MKIYTSHSNYCSGWDIDKIIEGTSFRKSCNTGRFKWKEKGIEMLDWDFKTPDWGRHLEITKYCNGLEVVMCPDVLIDSDVDLILRKANKLQKYCGRVVIPVHKFDKKLLDYELAYPNMRGFSPKNIFWVHQIQDNVTHILGGSPHRQKEMSRYFPKLKSIDGNMLFQCAIHYGKYWDNKSPWWFKIPYQTDGNRQAFQKSVCNVNKLWNGK